MSGTFEPVATVQCASFDPSKISTRLRSIMTTTVYFFFYSNLTKLTLSVAESVLIECSAFSPINLEGAEAKHNK